MATTSQMGPDLASALDVTPENRADKKIALLIADVDGTLLTRQKVLTRRAKAAVKALEAAGIAFAVTSGRPPRGMAMLINAVQLKTPVTGFNGGMMVHPNMRVIDEHPLDPDAARRAVTLLERQGIDVWVYCGPDWLIRDSNAPHVAREQSTVQFEPTVVEEFGPALNHAIKIVGVSDQPDVLARCKADATSALDGHASIGCSQTYYLDITHPDSNKGTAVEKLSEFMSIPTGQIVTIGDMPTDVPMFRKSGLAIAMGHASAEVQDEAEFVTASNDDEGFAKAVETVVLGHASTNERRLP